MNEFCIWCALVSLIVLLCIAGFTIWMVHPRVMPVTVRGLRRNPVNMLGVIGFIFGFAAFTLLVTKNGNINNGEYNVVTIFSLLVTALVTWQIWMTITSREEIKEMRDSANQVAEENTRLRQLIERERHHCEGLRWQIEGKNFLAQPEKDHNAPCMAYIHLAMALEHYIYSFQHDMMYINDVLDNMEASIGNAKEQPLAADQFSYHSIECQKHENEIMDILHLLGTRSQTIRNRFTSICHDRADIVKSASSRPK